MKNILSQNAFWIVNKSIAREVGLDASLLLSDLVTKQEYFNEEWFFNTADNIEVDTTLSPHQQRKAIKILIDKEFIETKLKGLPAKQHFKIVHNKLLNFLTTSYEKSEELYNKNKPNNNKVIIDADSEKSDSPTLKERIKEKSDNAINPMNGRKYSNKSETLFNTIKNEFKEIFLSRFNQSYYFTGKDGAKIKSLINKIRHAYKTTGKENPTEEEIVNGFSHICKRALNDKWISENFTLSIIDSQFNKLKISKNGKEKNQSILNDLIAEL